MCYELVLGGDAFVDEDGAVFGFLWMCEDGGDGIAYGRCSGDAEWDVASVDDCAQLCQFHNLVSNKFNTCPLQEAMDKDTIPSAVLDPTLTMNGTLLSPQSRKGPVMSKL